MNPDTYITPVFNKLLDKAERHIKYIVSTSSYVRNLQKKREKLNARKNDINKRIDDEGGRMLQRPTEEVVVWQNQAVEMLDRIDAALNKAQETRSCVCLICSKHKLGYSCDDMIKEVDELLEQPLSDLMVDCDTSNIVRSMSYVVPDSQESYFAEALKCIDDDNSKANIIGIWGPGGVGKTTLLKKIHDHFVGTSSMLTVIWTVASREQNDVSRVQSEIVKKLRLKEDNDVQSQADIIKSFLENKNFLLFIDDLWKDVDLHEVGVPNPNEGSLKRKVIFTTRFKDVCGQMDARKIIEVKCLDHTHSMILFTEKVGEEVIHSHPNISKLAEDIVKECKGLPLALKTIGRAMSTKPNIDDWKSTLFLLKNSQGHHVSGVDEKLLPILKISYDHLATEQLKKGFLTISMWPEDHEIHTKRLIEFWMGIELIDKFESIHEAYQLGHSLIGSLLAACLLEEVGREDSHSNEFVKMHDVLRDLALWLASDCGKNKNKWMVKAGIQLRDAPKTKAIWTEAECISLMHNKIKELPSDIPTCPSLLTLVLRSNQFSVQSLNCLGKFHSLTHLDLFGNYLDSFPESICDLTKLRYLNLSYNMITNLPTKLRNLKMLRYLILRDNRITNIPRGVFAELSELLVLDMFNAINTQKYPPLYIEELKSIEKRLLRFGTNVKTEEKLSKLMLLSELPIDALSIEDLRITTFHFMAEIRNPHRLKELHICSCSDRLLEIVYEKNGTYRDNASLNLEILKLYNLEKLKKIIWKDIAPEILFVELRKVEIVNCDLLKDITWVIHLPSLEHLSAKYCKSMKIAINNDVDPQVSTFPSLKGLYLYKMDILEKISTHSLALPQLKGMYISKCSLLKALPFEVETTPKLREIRGAKEWWEKVEWGDDNSRSYFNQFFTPWPTV